MPVSFSRLRIAGFKSFAEPAVVELLPGTTGIVGPNGCGKSNVVEALRWAMGENSARSMRGGEMDDVIFAGTAARPSRNIAEVVLTLGDGETAVFPPPFHENAELQVSRRIERGNGSVYRVNGREMRARDVHTLFADLASGARSSAMVSQGRVSALVDARPDERRSILEEAAGITGLHARRHEAELKLRAAETNLSRAEDLRGQLAQQLQGLQRQARQAARFRNISGHARAAEADLLALQRARVALIDAQAAQALHAAGLAVAAATEAATQASARAAHTLSVLPRLRDAEAIARTDLERRRLAQEQIAAEETRARAALAAATLGMAQLGRDLGHAEQLQVDAGAALARLDAEEAALAAELADHPALAEAAERAVAAAEAAVREADAEATRTTEHAAELGARGRALAQELAGLEARFARQRDLLERLTRERQQVVPVDPARLSAAETEVGESGAGLSASRTALERADQVRAAAQVAHAGARERLTRDDAGRARLAASVQALAEVLGVRDGERWPPMVDLLTVPEGLEAALGAALGEELESAADQAAARHWRVLGSLADVAPLPKGAAALGAMVRAPDALARALSQIGLVEDGDALQQALAPGQLLVSRGGAVWRWDGYTIRAGTPTAAAVRLQQRNRLHSLRGELAAAEQATAAARAASQAAEAAERAADAAERQARTARRDAEQRVERARAGFASLRSQAAAAAARLAGLDEQIGRARPDHDEAAASLEQVRAAHAALPDLSEARQSVERARASLAAGRAEEGRTRSGRDTLLRQAAARTARLAAIARERGDWVQRAEDAAGRVAELAARRAAAAAEIAAIADAPAEIAGRRSSGMEALERLDLAHKARAEALSAAEQAAQEEARSERAAEATLGRVREDLVRAEGAAEQAALGMTALAERIAERLGPEAALPEPPAELTAEAEDKARRRLERLQKEREEMGPVNLRAEVEATEIEEQIGTIARESEELNTAINKLRGSIGHLNREGRERLSQIFADVDRHFQALFSRMFGGGRAHLALVGSDDPLSAGLEIYAQPPGKKLATLSLLSGGEQALTALSLIFAVFRCNPAPVCVLDEVDAPLDDANVERFCLLIGDMVRETGTRFLVVTHHHVTMARMDRLYGVTMQERGVSRLLSVDLARAAELIEPRMAAE